MLWSEAFTEDGTPYYYNTETNETVWEKPSDFDSRESEVHNTPIVSLQSSSLPPNWEESTDGDGNIYYYNALTQETSWEKPSDPTIGISLPPPVPAFDFGFPEPPPPSTPEPDSDGFAAFLSTLPAPSKRGTLDETSGLVARKELQPNWESVVDDNGDVYYYNSVTQETQWDAPYVQSGWTMTLRRDDGQESRKKAEEEKRKKEEEDRKRRDEDKRKKEEEERRRKEDEEKRKKEIKRQQEEEKRKREEDERKRKEDERLRKEEEKRRKEDEKRKLKEKKKSDVGSGISGPVLIDSSIPNLAPQTVSSKLKDLALGNSAGNFMKNSGLPANWEMVYDDQGNPYYYNSVTQETSWEPPSTPRNRGSVASGWEAVQDEDGSTYYYNAETGDTSWDPPSSQTTSANLSLSFMNATRLPPNWEECNDDDGNIYYYNNLTDQTTWEKPIYGRATLIPIATAQALLSKTSSVVDGHDEKADRLNALKQQKQEEKMMKRVSS
eukprot:TRINITY_DN1113_c1_g1_i4.p1 TRINITY_DN1113_c1_g1~~TRINITY_DN1113_c1_g1_i4.p1  ORF type:complete len:495 (-),score=167.90 TRINITY_DN1113_c1_g1_i4:1287-2771(-)